LYVPSEYDRDVLPERSLGTGVDIGGRQLGQARLRIQSPERHQRCGVDTRSGWVPAWPEKPPAVQPPVVGLAGRPEHPARHRHRHPARGIGGGRLADERLHHSGQGARLRHVPRHQRPCDGIQASHLHGRRMANYRCGEEASLADRGVLRRHKQPQE
jgi:hypothetical protein